MRVKDVSQGTNMCLRWGSNERALSYYLK